MLVRQRERTGRRQRGNVRGAIGEREGEKGGREGERVKEKENINCISVMRKDSHALFIVHIPDA